MKRYELGLAKGYVSDWGVQEALRELTQNGIDQEVSVEGNTFSIDYDEEKMEMRLCNKKSVLNKSTLLLGCSSKADDSSTIGKFGEGYKLAVLVLLRNGYDVRIENYGARELWKFRFARLKKYDKVESLVVDIDNKHIWDRVPNNDLTIVISGVDADDFADYNERKINDECEVYETSYGKILVDEEYKGKIFVNGLFVCDTENFQYGYSFKPEFINIGRDRNLVNNWDISAVTKAMWLETDNIDEINRLVHSSAPDVEHLKYSWNTTRCTGSVTYNREMERKVADSTWNKVKEKHGEVLIARDESEKVMKERRFKRKCVVLTDLEYDTIENHCPSYSQFESECENDICEEEMSLLDQLYSWKYEQNISDGDFNSLLDILREHVELDEQDVAA